MGMSDRQALIKLDLDKCVEPDMEGIRGRVERAGYVLERVVSSHLSPSGTGWHIVFRVKPRPTHPMEVVALQAICGSDLYREAMQMQRARRFRRAPVWMKDVWNVLYQPHAQRQRHLKLEE